MTTKQSTEETEHAPDATGAGPENASAASDGPGVGEEATGDRENASQDVSESTEDGQQGGGNEAARYRRRLRDTERERDALAQQVTTMQAAEVTRLAAETLADPGDLLALGTGLADVLTDGTVDPDKVHRAAAALVKSRPNLRRTPPFSRAGIGQERPGGTGPRSGASWNDLISRARG